MRILFLTWKDIKHPFAWWAEKVIYEYAKWLVLKWHQITWFWYSYKDCLETEIIDWIQIIRKFNLYNSYFLFPKYYKKNLAWKYDLIIDEAWGLPFLSPKFEKNIPIIFFAHHIWDLEWDYSFPFPLNKIWKIIYFWLFKQYKNNKTITVSNSTKEELVENFWFKKDKVEVITNACDVTPIEKIDFSQKEDRILFLGRLMPIKRVEHAILAFNRFIKSDDKFANYKLDIVWNNQDKKYLSILNKLIEDLWLKNKVNFLWHIDRKDHNSFMFKQKLILVTSIKEWFWLIVLEWNSYWISAIWYNVCWLRDSISDWKNGYLIKDWDYNAMWDKIWEIIWNNETIENISNSSLEYVKILEWWDKKVDKFEKIILEEVKS